MRKERNGESVERPFDSLPPGYNPVNNSHWRAWAKTIPNFPFDGQMWAYDKYTTGYKNGRPRIGRYKEGFPDKLKGYRTKVADKSKIEWLEKPYPPEEETAKEFEWNDELIAKWKRAVKNADYWYSMTMLRSRWAIGQRQ